MTIISHLLCSLFPRMPHQRLHICAANLLSVVKLELPEIKNKSKNTAYLNLPGDSILCTNVTSGVMGYNKSDNFGCGMNSDIKVPSTE